MSFGNPLMMVSAHEARFAGEVPVQFDWPMVVRS